MRPRLSPLCHAAVQVILCAGCLGVSVDTATAFGSAIERLPEEQIVILKHLDLTGTTPWQRGERHHYYELNAAASASIDIRGQCCDTYNGNAVGFTAAPPGQCHLLVPIGVVLSIQTGVSLVLDNLYISEDPSSGVAGGVLASSSAQGTLGPGLLLQVHPGAELWMVQVTLLGNGKLSQAVVVQPASASAAAPGSVFMTNCSVTGFLAPGDRSGVVYNEGFLSIQDTTFLQNSANLSTSGVIATGLPFETSPASLAAITRLTTVFFEENSAEHQVLKLAVGAAVAADFDVPGLTEVLQSGSTSAVSYDRLGAQDVQKLPSPAQSRFGTQDVTTAFSPEVCDAKQSVPVTSYFAAGAGVVAVVVIACIARGMHAKQAGFSPEANKQQTVDAGMQQEEVHAAPGMSGELSLPGLPRSLAFHVMQAVDDNKDILPSKYIPPIHASNTRPGIPTSTHSSVPPEAQHQHMGPPSIVMQSSGEVRSQADPMGSWPTHDMAVHVPPQPRTTYESTRSATMKQREQGRTVNSAAHSVATEHRESASGVVDALDELCEAQVPFMGKYRLKGSIAQRVGGQGCVQFVTHLHTGEEYAVKFFLNNAAFQSERKLYERPELRRMMPATKEVVSNADGAIRAPSGYTFPPCIIVEKGQSLQEFASGLERGPDGCVTSLAQLTMLQAIIFVADRLHQLHSAGFVHRDIKPGNILRLPQQHAWTLIDFGSTVPVGEPARLSFTLNYAPPEVIVAFESGSRTVVAAPAVDVWALGVVAWEVLTGRPVLPATELSAQQIRDRIVGRAQLPWEAPGAGSLLRRLGRLGRTVMACLHRDPEQRPSASDVVASWNDMYSMMTAAYPLVST